MWLVAGAAVVLGGLVVVVAALVEPDPRPVPVPSGPVTPRDLRSVRFPIVWRGYDPGHVDAVLARAAAALEDAQRYGAVGPAEDGALPGFLARTFGDEPAHDEDPPGVGEPAPAREPDAEPGAGEASGEELEDAGGDDPGRLDR